MIDNFQIDNEKINQLSSMVTITEIINYVKRDILKVVEEKQQSDEKIRVVRR
jgi:ribosomal protein L19E